MDKIKGDIIRARTKRWFFIFSYRDAETRKMFSPAYGLEFRFIMGAINEIKINIFFHRFVLFIALGRRYRQI